LTVDRQSQADPEETFTATTISVRYSANTAVGSKQVWRPVWIR